MIYEYKTLLNLHPTSVQGKANRLSQQGWRLVSVTSTSSKFAEVMAIFERELPQPSAPQGDTSHEDFDLS